MTTPNPANRRALTFQLEKFTAVPFFLFRPTYGPIDRRFERTGRQALEFEGDQRYLLAGMLSAADSET
jgi:hypothetical protein